MRGAEDILEGKKRLTIPGGVRWPAGHPLAKHVVGPRASTDLLEGRPHEIEGAP